MKILQINSVCGVKSTGRITTDIAAQVEGDGHECKIAYGRGDVPESAQKYAIKIGGKFSVYAHALYARAFDGAGLGSKSATKKFVKWIEEYDPDVIHMHNIHGYYLHLPTLFDYLKKAGKKVVWTLHDCWPFTGHCSHFDYAGCDKWKTGCENCPQKGAYPRSFLDKSRRNYAWKKETFLGVKDMTITTPSNWMADLIGQSFLKDYPIKVVRNGADISRFQPTPSQIKEKEEFQDKKIVLAVSTAWGERKGLNDVYALAERLDEGYQVVIIGLTKKQIKTALKKVIALPKTDDVASLAGWYTAADVLVNCSYEESSSMVNLEAQACGTPVLTYATGGAVETVPEGHTVPKGDVEKMAAALADTIDKKEILPRSMIDKTGIAAKYLEIYRGV